MLYIFCAVYPEAAGLIEHYKLKKLQTPPSLKFDVFENQEAQIRLILTGIGMINAATAVGSVYTTYCVTSDDRMINLGTCASNEPLGTVLIANKIINQTTGRTFYPDMLIKTRLKEGTVITLASAATRADTATGRADAFDMESAAIYEAAAFFMAPHSMSFLKIVSDNGIDSGLNNNPADGIDSGLNNNPAGDIDSDLANYAGNVKKIFSAVLPQLLEYIEQVRTELENKFSAATSDTVQNDDISASDISIHLYNDMRCSKTMEARLNQLIRYSSCASLDLQQIVNSLYNEGLLPAKSKTDGKKALDELSRRLI